MATSTIASEIEKRKPRAKVYESFARDLLGCLESVSVESKTITWPSSKYLEDPSGFVRDILGCEPWSRQAEIMDLVRDHDRVAIASGHKLGKTFSVVFLALWFYCTRPDARVIMSSTTSRQVDSILWRALSMIKARSGICVACKRKIAKGEKIKAPCEHSAVIDGEIGMLARTGLKSRDFREIVGFTAREAEAVAGISGENLFYIIDEASGVPDVIFQAIDGNRAGGAKIVLISNPTRTEGEFYDAFHSKEHLYKTARISSEESPNVIAGRRLIPGLATREWIEEKRVEYGEDSPFYKIRIKGEFAEGEDGKIISIASIIEAEQRWTDTPEDGELYVSIDPAGPGGQGDESVFVIRRGKKMIGLRAFRGLTDESHLAHAIGILRDSLGYREKGTLVVDREGSIGSKLYGFLLGSSELKTLCRVNGVRSSDGATREPSVYGRIRDELWANLAQWIRGGGAIIEDSRLSRELHAPEWTSDIRGRLKATAKEDLRKALGRSPDRADALALAVWETVRYDDAIDDDESTMDLGVETTGAINPYGGALNPWG